MKSLNFTMLVLATVYELIVVLCFVFLQLRTAHVAYWALGLALVFVLVLMVMEAYGSWLLTCLCLWLVLVLGFLLSFFYLLIFILGTFNLKWP